jgi:tetratricopeptide (TPR) repeat protein
VTSDSGYTTEVGYQGFQRTCRIVHDFFEAKLKGDPSGIERLRADVGQAAGAAMTHKNALPTPPSAHEFVALMADKGFDAAVQIVERFRRDAPGVIVVDQRVFNRLGYNLIAEKRFAEAIGVLRLVSYVYPKSWNAADSLGDAYIAAGQKEEGRAAYQRALNLAAADPDIDPDRRKSIIKDEQTKLEKLKP